MTLEELKAMYAEKGGTEKRYTDTEQGRTEEDVPIQYGDGWAAWEKDNRKIIDYIGQGMDATPVYDDAPKTLGGFSKQEGDYITDYDLNGNAVARRKWNESDLKTMWNDLGPIAMAALTMGGGAGALGSYLFPSLGATAAAGAGGALAGGFNAAMNDQNILKGALMGGAGSAGALQLGDTGFTLGDATKAISFAQNPTLAGAVNIASPYVPNLSVGDGAVSLNDIFKGVGTAQALGSGDYGQIFKAITGMAGDQGKSVKSSLSGFDTNPDDFIEGYFQPGGEGYIDPNREEMTVREEPENIDSLLRSLSPYSTDEGKSVFAQEENIPEMETVAKRPRSLTDILGTPNILEEVPQDDEPYIPSLRTKEIKSDIPDEITVDEIEKLFPDIDFNDILQTVTTPETKTVVPTKTVTPTTVTPAKVTVPGTTTTEQALANLGLNAPMPSQDPYANIKLMEELFGGDTAYKLRALGAPKNQASTDMDALARLLRKQNG
jgi:hypothetical protein